MTQRKVILVLAALSMVSFGIVLTTLGASLPSVIARFGIDKRQAGTLLSLLSFGVLAGSIVFGPVVDRRGYRGTLLFAFAAIIVGLEAIAFARSLIWLRAGVLLIGFAGGIVNGAANALVADVSTTEQRGPALTFVGAFFGVGAGGVPFVLSILSDTFPQSAILSTSAAIVLLPLIVTMIAAFPSAKQPHGFPVAEARRLLSDRVLLLMGMTLFLESGMETTVGGWTPTFFAEELNVSADRAPMYLAVFWLGLMLARLALGLLKTESSIRALYVSVGTALASAVLLVVTHSVGAAAFGAFLLGCGFAAVFPIIFAFAVHRYARLSGTALSLVMAMALVGGMLMPYATGAVAASYGLRAGLLIVPVSLALMAGLLGRISKGLGAVGDTSAEGLRLRA